MTVYQNLSLRESRVWQHEFTILSLYEETLAITKFKIRQCILMTYLPYLMLAKVSRYTVYEFDIGLYLASSPGPLRGVWYTLYAHAQSLQKFF